MTQRLELPAEKVLTVVADALGTGVLKRSAPSGSSTTYTGADIAAGSTTTVGPFDHPRIYEIETLSGSITYSVADGETTDSSASLASALSDETGTGAAVFGTGPTITGAVITRKVTTASADGAVTVESGNVKITKSASAAALTLAATATDGVEIQFTSTTDKAHTITAAIQDGVTGGDKTTATFAAFAGASIRLLSVGSKWAVIASNNVTVT